MGIFLIWLLICFWRFLDTDYTPGFKPNMTPQIMAIPVVETCKNSVFDVEKPLKFAGTPSNPIPLILNTLLETMV